MAFGRLSSYFQAIAAKRLSAVEAEPRSSNQHEFNSTRGLQDLFGTHRQRFEATFVFLSDMADPVLDSGTVTWYDARKAHPKRSEYRLYYPTNAVMELASRDDFLLVAERPSNQLLVAVASGGSSAESRLKWLFGLPDQEELYKSFEYRSVEGGRDIEIELLVSAILDELGIEPHDTDPGEIDAIVEGLAGKFPSTREFSELARKSLPHVDPRDDPDAALLAWLEREERMFRSVERTDVSERLRQGFIKPGDEVDVDSYVKHSLRVLNRRKSRAGQALEHHAAAIFDAHGLRFDRQAYTEGKSRPDFLFPGRAEYIDSSFPETRLLMLAAKSTLKDRWRQIPTEAERIRPKHVLTIEAGLSSALMAEMDREGLQLVLPQALHKTFQSAQQQELFDLAQFIKLVASTQSSKAGPSS